MTTANLREPVHVGDHVRGTGDIPATLVIYGDYECPYTRQAYHAVQRVLAEEPHQLRFVFRHFPLTRIHPHAEHASEAAEAAAARGQFWEMHDAMFSHQKALEDTDLQRYAQDLGLDADRLIQEVRAGAHSARIQQDVRSGLASGVHGTPTLYFNGYLHLGGFDDASLRASIRQIVSSATPS
jgi:protein-disulfide isomerase